MADLNELKPVDTVQDIINKFCYTIGMIPSSYKISLSYEEQILSIGQYLEETVIPALNNNAEAVLELQNLYVALKNYVDNYFDNLDVQEEINNKLNQMAEDGSLTQLIEDYVNPYILAQNNEIEIIEEKVDAVSSGSPAGTYSTVSDLTTADPNHSKIYLVLADGKWYYYNTTQNQWVAGGVYQGTTVSSNDPTIKEMQLDISNLQEDTQDLLFKSYNLFNRETISEEFRTLNQNGEVVETSGDYAVSDFIEVIGGKTIYCVSLAQATNIHRICAYDINKNYISNSYQAGVTSYEIPQNARYIRFDRSYETMSEANIMISYYLFPYIPYGIYEIRNGTYYVDYTNGNDNYSGYKYDPFKTITKALSMGAKKIILATDTYPKLAFSDHDVEIIGNGSSIDANNSGNALRIENSKVILKDLTFKNGSTNGLYLIDCEGEIINCIAEDNTSSGFRLDGSKIELKNCIAQSNGIDGFNAHDTQNNISKGYFENCKAISNEDDGLSYHEEGEIIVMGGEYNGNGSGGITPAVNCKAKIYNAILKNNTHGINCSGPSENPSGTCFSFNNLLQNNTNGIRQANGYIVNSINDVFDNNTNNTSGNVNILKS